MKKWISVCAVLLLMVVMTACGNTNTTTPADGEVNTPTNEPVAQEKGFSFTYEGVEIVPGAAFDVSALPQAASTYEVPSCAIEGTDTVYNYNTFEVTAYNDGTGEKVYSVYFLDANTATAEGLYLGDTADRVTELYGDAFTEDGTARVYSRGETLFSVILQDGYVASMEYRWDTQA